MPDTGRLVMGALGIPLPLPKWFPLSLTEFIKRQLLGKYRFLNVDLNRKVHAAYHAISIDENREVFWTASLIRTHFTGRSGTKEREGSND